MSNQQVVLVQATEVASLAFQLQEMIAGIGVIVELGKPPRAVQLLLDEGRSPRVVCFKLEQVFAAARLYETVKQDAFRARARATGGPMIKDTDTFDEIRTGGQSLLVVRSTGTALLQPKDGEYGG